MDTDISLKIIEAARAALSELEVEGITVEDAVQHRASYDFAPEKWSIHFRRTNGEYFRVILDTRHVHTTYGARNRENLTAEIVSLFQDSNNHIPL